MNPDRPCMDAWQIANVFQHHGEIRHILPDEEIDISADRIVDKIMAESTTAGSMLMHDATCGRQQARPASLPGVIGDVCVFDIERSVQIVEAANLQKFQPIECA